MIAWLCALYCISAMNVKKLGGGGGLDNENVQDNQTVQVELWDTLDENGSVA